MAYNFNVSCYADPRSKPSFYTVRLTMHWLTSAATEVRGINKPVDGVFVECDPLLLDLHVVWTPWSKQLREGWTSSEMHLVFLFVVNIWYETYVIEVTMYRFPFNCRDWFCHTLRVCFRFVSFLMFAMDITCYMTSISSRDATWV